MSWTPGEVGPVSEGPMLHLSPLSGQSEGPMLYLSPLSSQSEGPMRHLSPLWTVPCSIYRPCQAK